MELNSELMAGPRRSRKRSGKWILLLLIFVIAAIAVIWWRASHSANTSYIQPKYISNPSPIMFKGEWTDVNAIGTEEGLLIPLDIAERLLGDGVHYEEKSETVVLTTDTKVLHFKTGELDATLNRKPFSLRFAAKKVDDTLYLPVAPLTELFGVKAEIGKPSGIVSLFMPGEAIQHAAVPEKTSKGIKLREGPGKSFPIIEDLPAGSDLRLWGEEDSWYKAQSKAGNIGYVSKGAVSLLAIETITSDSATEEPFVAWKSSGNKINLTWEAVYSANPDTKKIGELSGVNVVSPTWFELVDGKGNIRSKADAQYSAWARAKGIQVWGLFSNGFEPDRTHTALATYETRFAMIQQLLAYAKTFKLQGVNIDFENVYTKDKDNLVQFVRELTPLLHEYDLVVSIDVTPKSNSEMWSVFLDRERLGASVDFMMVMAYDEHWASSPVAGSVSSLPWVENSIKRIVEEDRVPSDKLILGVPLYTRIWTEEPNGKGGVNVSSKTMNMEAVAKLITDKKLKPSYSEETGQNYIEFKEGKLVKKIWIEDASSIKARAELARKYNLAGVASWRRGFETNDIWGTLDKTLQNRSK
ncbi:glycosyl hydrolase family 18 protein [Cohnella mopanensis]|uniref:glycosyl hydrolase family 18 protein n=1 Tax=Cohnella mopanensis TaxID=2911966 RepID=UPI001EF8A6C3|nr:glycosyl hydrolase family 18 protein [Cohnella mopanensis]